MTIHAKQQTPTSTKLSPGAYALWLSKDTSLQSERAGLVLDSAGRSDCVARPARNLLIRSRFAQQIVGGAGGGWYSQTYLLGGDAERFLPRIGRQDLAMLNPQPPTSDDIEQLLLNARLRDELEPFCDESFDLLDNHRLPTREENEFLASMLAWERAPVLPISQWFQPELQLPRPETLTDRELHRVLWDTLNRLYDKRIVLDFTDHLSDRQLYCLIFRDILSSHEKKIDLPRNYLHWHCLDDDNDPEIWLRYYASEEEREAWAEEANLPLPPAETPPYPRRMPRRPQ